MLISKVPCLGFDSEMDIDIAEASKNHSAIGGIRIDLDNFKKYKDVTKCGSTTFSRLKIRQNYEKISQLLHIFTYKNKY